LLLEHYLKLQRTRIATPRKIIVPKNLDFTDPVYRKKLRLPLAKLGAFVHQYFVNLLSFPSGGANILNPLRPGRRIYRTTGKRQNRILIRDIASVASIAGAPFVMVVERCQAR